MHALYGNPGLSANIINSLWLHHTMSDLSPSDLDTTWSDAKELSSLLNLDGNSFLRISHLVLTLGHILLNPIRVKDILRPNERR